MMFILRGRPISKKNGWKPRPGGRGIYQSVAGLKDYKLAIYMQFKMQMRGCGFEKIPSPTPVAVRVFVYFDPNQHAMDVHNAVETLLDCLQGVAYDNDNQVVGFYTPPVRLVDARNPRIEVEVLTAEEALKREGANAGMAR